MKIYIGFSSPVSKFAIFADIIKWVEARPYDHVYIRMQYPNDSEYFIFQSSKEQVNIFNKDIFQSVNIPYKEYEIDPTDEQYADVWAFVKKSLGIPYSLKEDFGILLMKIFKLKKNPFRNGMSAAFCSELGAVICKMLGINILVQASAIDPSLLDSLLEAAKLPCVMSPTF